MSKITLKSFVHEDFVNYKKPSLFIAFPYCSFKCGKDVCQNTILADSLNIYVSAEKLAEMYIHNPITQAIVIGGLEPFDSKDELYTLIKELRKHTQDTIVIYSGYTEDELKDEIIKLKAFKNILIKVGRYIPNKPKIFNELLGVTLASDNQYVIEV